MIRTGRYNDDVPALEAENERLRAATKAAVRCAKLALFVIRKHGVMPNASWECGFNADLKIAEDALQTIEPT